MSEGHQGYHHGVHKNLAEGIGGALIGAALVLLARSWLKQRARPAAPSQEDTPPTTKPQT